MNIAKIKNKDKENKRLNSKFMNMSTRKRRIVPLFMDEYTQKDDDQQNKILNLNAHLDNKIDKHSIEKKIDDFLSDFERKALFDKLYSEDTKVAEIKNELFEKVRMNILDEPENDTYHVLNDYKKEDAHVKINQQLIDNEMNNNEKKEEYYKMYKEFKNKLIEEANRDKTKNKFNIINSIIKNSKSIRQIDQNNFLNQTSKDIIMSLRRHSMERKATLNNLSKLKTHGFRNSNIY